MNNESLIGSRLARGAAVVLALVAGAVVALDLAGAWPAWHGALRGAAVVVGLLAVLAGVHWSQRIYRGWMRGAGAINVVVSTILFGACYLLVVPAFWAVANVRRLARAKGSKGGEWHARRPVPLDIHYFERMG